MNCRITHIGTATLLLEIGPIRLLTDPTFDPPGGTGRKSAMAAAGYAREHRGLDFAQVAESIIL